MDVWAIIKEWLREEEYTFFARPPGMVPYKSWIQIEVDTIQLWTQTGETVLIITSDNSLMVDHYDVDTALNHGCCFKEIDLHDPNAFEDLKRYLNSL